MNYTQHVQQMLHKTIKKVTEDIESFKFNTAVSAMMIALKDFEDAELQNALAGVAPNCASTGIDVTDCTFVYQCLFIKFFFSITYSLL